MNKKLLLLAASTAAVLLAPGHLLGADRSSDRTTDTSGDRNLSAAGAPASGNTLDTVRASELRGMAVRNTQNEKLGDVRDVIIDFPQSRVDAIVVGSGGILGIGEKVHAVPPQSFNYAAGEKELVLNTDRTTFQSGPAWNDRTGYAGLGDVYQHYGQQRYWNQSGRTMVREREMGTTRSENRAADQADLAKADRWRKASDLIGKEVRSTANENLGSVNDLVVDLKSGRIVYAILASGGVLGVGENLYAIPPNQFQLGSDAKHLALNVPKERLQQAPHFDRNRMSDLNNPQWASSVYSYYGTPAYWTGAGAMSSTTGTSPGRSLGQWDWHKSSDVIGMTVRNPANESLGKINDLVVDLKGGHIVFAVLSSGGALGLGSDLIAIPPSQFSFAANEKALVLNTDKQKLQQAPHLDKNRLEADLNNQQWAGQVYQHYGATPFWSTAERQPVREREGGPAMAWHKASDIVGKEVRGASNEDLGKVNDLVVDLKSGRIVYAILASGGVLGVGGDHFAVPASQFSFGGSDHKTLVLNITKEKLQQGPRVDKNRATEVTDPQWAQQVYQYYGETAFWNTGADSTRQPVRQREDSSTDRNKDQTPNEKSPE